jgi:LmbE family N-acetylglucosaminyl deacetylase
MPTFGVISAHLDDAAFSCSLLLVEHPGSRVVTVFTAGPEHVDPLSEWDVACAVFEPGDDVAAARRAEDAEACALVGASPLHLGYWEVLYRTPAYGYTGPVDDDLVAAVSADLVSVMSRERVDAWVVPLGLRHPDHRLTAAACWSALAAVDVDRYLYVDVPYVLKYGDEVAPALDLVRAAGFDLEPARLPTSGDLAAKRRALECHRSQLAAMRDGPDRALRCGETYFRLTPSAR